jgi:hypothetical protein
VSVKGARLSNKSLKTEKVTMVGSRFTVDFTRRLTSEISKETIVWAIHPIHSIGSLSKWSQAQSVGTRQLNNPEISTCEYPSNLGKRQGTIDGTRMDGGFTLSWSINAQRTNITMTMSIGGIGYLSIALCRPDNLYAQMPDVDAITGWVSNGTTILIDTWSPDYNIPFEDPAMGGRDDVILVSSSQTNGRTSITFSRALDTNDTWDLPIRDEFTHILYVYDPKPGNNVDRVYPYHIGKGYFRSVNLFQPNVYPSTARASSAVPTVVTPSTVVIPVPNNANNRSYPLTALILLMVYVWIH